MAVNVGALRSTNGQFKILTTVLIIIDLALARAGDGGDPLVQRLMLDHKWLLTVTIGGYAIIYSIFMVSYLLGDGIAINMEALFVLVGSVLFLASGSVVIQSFEHRSRSSLRTNAMALGSMALITGIVMVGDLALLLKRILGK